MTRNAPWTWGWMTLVFAMGCHGEQKPNGRSEDSDASDPTVSDPTGVPDPSGSGTAVGFGTGESPLDSGTDTAPPDSGIDSGIDSGDTGKKVVDTGEKVVDTGKEVDTGVGKDTGPVSIYDTAGDCVVKIPKDVVVIDSDSYTSDDNYVAYVCKNKVLSVVGDNAQIWVGTGGQLIVNGTGSTVYAKSGAELAFYEADNDILIEAGVSVEDDSGGEGIHVTTCTTVTFENEPAC